MPTHLHRLRLGSKTPLNDLLGDQKCTEKVLDFVRVDEAKEGGLTKG